MNFLGHAWFSGLEDDEFLTGNIFGDFIKGKIGHYSLPDGIIKGVSYHRYLDTVGDKCSGFISLRELLGHEFGHYRGVITDIFIDHLLSVNWQNYSNIPLETFAENTYRRVSKFIPLFPERTAHAFGYMQRDNWFVRNKSLVEIEKTLQRIENRAGNGINISQSVEILRARTTEFNKAFQIFMDEMIFLTGRNKLV